MVNDCKKECFSFLISTQPSLHCNTDQEEVGLWLVCDCKLTYTLQVSNKQNKFWVLWDARSRKCTQWRACESMHSSDYAERKCRSIDRKLVDIDNVNRLINYIDISPLFSLRFVCFPNKRVGEFFVPSNSCVRIILSDKILTIQNK